jgi:molecular chaperone GrpE
MTGMTVRRALSLVRDVRVQGASRTTMTTATTTTTRAAPRTITRAMDGRVMRMRWTDACGKWALAARERCASTWAFGKDGVWGGARARGFASEGTPADEATSENERGEDAEGDEEGQDELSRLRGELEEKDAKVADLTDRVLRTMAEMENLRERTRRQAEDAKKFAIQGFCKDLLDVADNLDRAIATVTVDDGENDVEKVKTKLKSFHEGVVMTEKTLLSAFQKNGVTKFNPEGEDFDANSHMALFNVPIPEGSDAKAGTIAAVTKTGFSLHDRVIRAAEVGVYQ